MPTSTHSNMAIKARHISLNFGKKVILDDINLDIHFGQVTALLGPNGTGKSTLLKILCGEIPLSSSRHPNAELSYFGKPAADWNKQELARHLGILPQHSTLSFPFLVKEVVELGGLPLSLSNAELNQATKEKMQIVGMENMAEHSYPLLSGGEKQRVHLARVLTQLHQAGDKRIFMLDEPTSALDLAHQHNTLSLAKTMAQTGTAVVIVLHDLNLAAQYCDRILLLNNGEIVCDGSPWEALTAENIQAVYGQKTLVTSHPEQGFPVVLSA